MGMGEAINLFFKNYANFNGRSRRSEYWWPYLALLIIEIVVIVLMLAVGGGVDSYGNPSLNPIGMALMGLLILFCLGILVPMLAVTIRRLHDKNMTGWFALIGLLPYVGGIILLVFMVLPGTVGPNKFGPDPKNPGGVAEDVFS